jgi:ABC-type Fe3+-hydroxamate transport system substrate-binding protein
VIRRRLLALLAVVGCSGKPSPAPTAQFLDPEGKPVVLDSLPVSRIASTMQSATEWIIALGATDRLVARTDFDRQPEIAHLPSLGGGLEASAEAVAALEPDVVLGWRIAASVSLSRTLAPFGIPVIAVEATDTAEAFSQLAAIGVLVGMEDRAKQLADSIRAELAALTQQACADGSRRESAMVVLWTDPPMTAGGPTWMTELMDAACLDNIFSDLASPWPTVSMEAIAQRAPMWLITTDRGPEGARLDHYRELPGWRDLAAVREGRVIELDGDLFARLGPTMADWVRAVIEGRRLVGRRD